MRALFRGTVLSSALLAGWIVLTGAANPGRGIWLDVPYVRQSPDGCGSACVSMVIRYWDEHAPRPHVIRESEEVIYRKLYSPQAGGIPAVSLRQYMEAQGFRVFVFKGAWQDLQEHLSKGRPLIVCLKGRSSHYVVVSGIDPGQGIVLVNDPARRKLLEVRRANFERGWEGAGDWTLLALP